MRCLPLLIALLSTTAYAQATATATPLGPPQIYRGSGTIGAVTSCAAGTALIWQVPGAGTARLDVTGTFVATIAVKSSGNGSTGAPTCTCWIATTLGGVGSSYGSSAEHFRDEQHVRDPALWRHVPVRLRQRLHLGHGEYSVTFSPDTRVVANVNIGPRRCSRR
jgi:hypothetical protein